GQIEQDSAAGAARDLVEELGSRELAARIELEGDVLEQQATPELALYVVDVGDDQFELLRHPPEWREMTQPSAADLRVAEVVAQPFDARRSHQPGDAGEVVGLLACI